MRVRDGVYQEPVRSANRTPIRNYSQEQQPNQYPYRASHYSERRSSYHGRQYFNNERNTSDPNRYLRSSGEHLTNDVHRYQTCSSSSNNNIGSPRIYGEYSGYPRNDGVKYITKTSNTKSTQIKRPVNKAGCFKEFNKPDKNINKPCASKSESSHKTFKLDNSNHKKQKNVEEYEVITVISSDSDSSEDTVVNVNMADKEIPICESNINEAETDISINKDLRTNTNQDNKEKRTHTTENKDLCENVNVQIGSLKNEEKHSESSIQAIESNLKDFNNKFPSKIVSKRKSVPPNFEVIKKRRTCAESDNCSRDETTTINESQEEISNQSCDDGIDATEEKIKTEEQDLENDHTKKETRKKRLLNLILRKRRHTISTENEVVQHFSENTRVTRSNSCYFGLFPPLSDKHRERGMKVNNKTHGNVKKNTKNSVINVTNVKLNLQVTNVKSNLQDTKVKPNLQVINYEPNNQLNKSNEKSKVTEKNPKDLIELRKYLKLKEKDTGQKNSVNNKLTLRRMTIEERCKHLFGENISEVGTRKDKDTSKKENSELKNKENNLKICYSTGDLGTVTTEEWSLLQVKNIHKAKASVVKVPRYCFKRSVTPKPKIMNDQLICKLATVVKENEPTLRLTEECSSLKVQTVRKAKASVMKEPVNCLKRCVIFKPKIIERQLICILSKHAKINRPPISSITEKCFLLEMKNVQKTKAAITEEPVHPLKRSNSFKPTVMASSSIFSNLHENAMSIKRRKLNHEKNTISKPNLVKIIEKLGSDVAAKQVMNLEERKENIPEEIKSTELKNFVTKLANNSDHLMVANRILNKTNTKNNLESTENNHVETISTTEKSRTDTEKEVISNNSAKSAESLKEDVANKASEFLMNFAKDVSTNKISKSSGIRTEETIQIHPYGDGINNLVLEKGTGFQVSNTNKWNDVDKQIVNIAQTELITLEKIPPIRRSRSVSNLIEIYDTLSNKAESVVENSSVVINKQTISDQNVQNKSVTPDVPQIVENSIPVLASEINENSAKYYTEDGDTITIHSSSTDDKVENNKENEKSDKENEKSDTANREIVNISRRDLINNVAAQLSCFIYLSDTFQNEKPKIIQKCGQSGYETFLKYYHNNSEDLVKAIFDYMNGIDDVIDFDMEQFIVELQEKLSATHSITKEVLLLNMHIIIAYFKKSTCDKSQFVQSFIQKMELTDFSSIRDNNKEKQIEKNSLRSVRKTSTTKNLENTTTTSAITLTMNKDNSNSSSSAEIIPVVSANKSTFPVVSTNTTTFSSSYCPNITIVTTAPILTSLVSNSVSRITGLLIPVVTLNSTRTSSVITANFNVPLQSPTRSHLTVNESTVKTTGYFPPTCRSDASTEFYRNHTSVIQNQIQSSTINAQTYYPPNQELTYIPQHQRESSVLPFGVSRSLERPYSHCLPATAKNYINTQMTSTNISKKTDSSKQSFHTESHPRRFSPILPPTPSANSNQYSLPITNTQDLRNTSSTLNNTFTHSNTTATIPSSSRIWNPYEQYNTIQNNHVMQHQTVGQLRNDGITHTLPRHADANIRIPQSSFTNASSSTNQNLNIRPAPPAYLDRSSTVVRPPQPLYSHGNKIDIRPQQQSYTHGTTTDIRPPKPSYSHLITTDIRPPQPSYLHGNATDTRPSQPSYSHGNTADIRPPQSSYPLGDTTAIRPPQLSYLHGNTTDVRPPQLSYPRGNATDVRPPQPSYSLGDTTAVRPPQLSYLHGNATDVRPPQLSYPRGNATDVRPPQPSYSLGDTSAVRPPQLSYLHGNATDVRPPQLSYPRGNATDVRPPQPSYSLADTSAIRPPQLSYLHGNTTDVRPPQLSYLRGNATDVRPPQPSYSHGNTTDTRPPQLSHPRGNTTDVRPPPPSYSNGNTTDIRQSFPYTLGNISSTEMMQRLARYAYQKTRRSLVSQNQVQKRAPNEQQFLTHLQQFHQKYQYLPPNLDKRPENISHHQNTNFSHLQSSMDQYSAHKNMSSLQRTNLQHVPDGVPLKQYPNYDASGLQVMPPSLLNLQQRPKLIPPNKNAAHLQTFRPPLHTLNRLLTPNLPNQNSSQEISQTFTNLQQMQERYFLNANLSRQVISANQNLTNFQKNNSMLNKELQESGMTNQYSVNLQRNDSLLNMQNMSQQSVPNRNPNRNYVQSDLQQISETSSPSSNFITNEQIQASNINQSPSYQSPTHPNRILQEPLYNIQAPLRTSNKQKSVKISSTNQEKCNEFNTLPLPVSDINRNQPSNVNRLATPENYQVLQQPFLNCTTSTNLPTENLNTTPASTLPKHQFKPPTLSCSSVEILAGKIKTDDSSLSNSHIQVNQPSSSQFVKEVKNTLGHEQNLQTLNCPVSSLIIPNSDVYPTEIKNDDELDIIENKIKTEGMFESKNCLLPTISGNIKGNETLNEEADDFVENNECKDNELVSGISVINKNKFLDITINTHPEMQVEIDEENDRNSEDHEMDMLEESANEPRSSCIAMQEKSMQVDFSTEGLNHGEEINASNNAEEIQEINSDSDGEIIEVSDCDSDTDSGYCNSSPVQIPSNDVIHYRLCICGFRAKYLCSCCNVIYCSSECQNNDWNNHRPYCKRN